MPQDVDVMVLAPHPDDAEITCAGTVMTLVAAGARVAIVDMTRGEMGTRGTPEVRRAECEAATRRMGVQVRRNLDLPDGGLRDDEQALRAVVGALRELRPRLLLAPADHDLHPDHGATGAVARRAFFHAGLAKSWPDLGGPCRPRRMLIYPLHDELPATLCVDISAVAEAKIDVVRCYASQVEFEDRSHLLGLDPLERTRARDAYWGSRIGRRAAEPFWSPGPLAVADPMPLLD